MYIGIIIALLRGISHLGIKFFIIALIKKYVKIKVVEHAMKSNSYSCVFFCQPNIFRPMIKKHVFG